MKIRITRDEFAKALIHCRKQTTCNRCQYDLDIEMIKVCEHALKVVKGEKSFSVAYEMLTGER